MPSLGLQPRRRLCSLPHVESEMKDQLQKTLRESHCLRSLSESQTDLKKKISDLRSHPLTLLELNP